MTTTAQHKALAAAWANYNGQRGTAKQLARIMRQLSVADLTRMLAARNIVIEEAR
jgi:hypothetical protein